MAPRKPSGFHVGLVMFMEKDLDQDERRSFAARTLSAHLAHVGAKCLAIKMPCGHIYEFMEYNVPLGNTPCGCGDRKHIAVLWRMPAKESY